MNRSRFLPRIAAVFFVSTVCLLFMGSVNAAVTYELKHKVVVEGKGWKIKPGLRPIGEVPALSPSADRVAFLRNGNIYLLSRRAAKPRPLTYLSPSSSSDDIFLPMRISWDSSGKWIAFTRALPMEYDKQHNVLRPIMRRLKQDENVLEYVQTIWLAEVKTGKAKQIIGPMGDLAKLSATSQIEGASVYEPMFSPDGKALCFLNGGWLYETQLNFKKLSVTGKPSLIARIGIGLDLSSPGASRWGTGAQQLAWDPKNSHLYYWIGRFWGSGESKFGRIAWNSGKWGKPEAWQPRLSRSIAEPCSIYNVWGGAFDSHGNFWVPAYIGNDTRWVRMDVKAKLPSGSGRPSWRP